MPRATPVRGMLSRSCATLCVARQGTIQSAAGRSRQGAADVDRSGVGPLVSRGPFRERWSSIRRGHIQRKYARDPRALTPREEQSAQLAGLGAPNGEIAYALGVTAECVSSRMHSALRKLGCNSRRDLISMIRAGNHEFTLDVHGSLIGVIAEPALSDQVPPSLTPAERRVFFALRAGKSNAEIASDFGTSVRTVANQVASICARRRHPRDTNSCATPTATGRAAAYERARGRTCKPLPIDGAWRRSRTRTRRRPRAVQMSDVIAEA